MIDNATAYDGFLSYSTDSKADVGRIHKFLQAFRRNPRAEPLRVYFDAEDFRAGPVSDELNQALDRSRVLIVCCTPAAAKSAWVDHEIEVFLRTHPPSAVVLLLIKGTAIESVPKRLGSLNLKTQNLTSGLGP